MAYKSTDRVLQKVSDDEPIFVLRAQDLSAPDVIMFWLTQNQQLSDPRKQEALRCIDAMRAWPKRKVAD